MRLHNLVSTLLRDIIDGWYPLFRWLLYACALSFAAEPVCCGPFRPVNRLVLRGWHFYACVRWVVWLDYRQLLGLEYVDGEIV